MKRKLSKFTISVGLLFLCSIFVFSGCSDTSSSNSEDIVNNEYAEGFSPGDHGMVIVEAAGKSITNPEGWDEDFTASFSYNFEIGSHEVTVHEFQELMNYSGNYGETQFPIQNISWYDAILYCNALSKKHNLDTVYTYSKIFRSESDNAYEIKDLEWDFSKEGFRLPTNAEWTFVANSIVIENLDNIGWYTLNSNSELHPVKTKEPMGLYFWDLYGNVMEWVYDWYSDFPAGEFSDFLGPQASGGEGDKTVKGGSFKHGAQYANPWMRRDVYPLLPSTTAEYIGFRVARGSIENPSYIENLESFTEVHQHINQESLTNLLGHSNVKTCMVARSEKELVCHDFSGSKPAEYRFRFAESINHPEISPDGNWVAFSSTPEGSSNFSEIFIKSFRGNRIFYRGVGAIPRWHIQGPDTFLVYNSSAASNEDSIAWSSQMMIKRLWQNYQLSDIPEIFASASWNGGFSQSAELLASGSTKLRVNNHGTILTLFQSPENGKDPEASDQVCNVSMSPLSNRLAFIDFGYSDSSTITGESYDIHEVLFISDSLGNIQKFFYPPDNWNMWNHPEWTNQEEWIISNVSDVAGINTEVYLLNHVTEDFVKLYSGKALAHVTARIGDSAALPPPFSLDSLGVYNQPILHSSLPYFFEKLHLFWEKSHDLQGVVLGSSRAYNGIKPSLLDKPTLNMSYAGGGLSDVYEIMQNYIENHAPHLEYIILSLDLDLINRGEDILQNIHQTYGWKYDSLHQFWQNTPPPLSLMQEQQYIFSNGIRLRMDDFGFESIPSGNSIVAECQDDLWFYEFNTEQNLSYLENVLQLAKDRNIQVLGIEFPQIPDFAELPCYGRYGPPYIEMAEDLHQQIEELESRYSNFTFINENNGSYNTSHFADSDHMSESGAERLTNRIKQYLP
jgi:uncharacterized protein (TIGR02171 family)